MFQDYDKEKLLKIKALLEAAEKDKKDEYKGKGYMNRRSYEKKFDELGVDEHVAYNLLNRVERKVGNQWYAVAKEHAEEFGKDSPLHWNFEVCKDDARREEFWSKIFAYDVKNERNEHGVLIDYGKARVILKHGSSEFGESKAWAIQKAIHCSEEDAKQIVANYEYEQAKDYVLGHFSGVLANFKSSLEVEKKLKNVVIPDRYDYRTLADAYVTEESKRLAEYLEGLPAEKGTAQENQ